MKKFSTTSNTYVHEWKLHTVTQCMMCELSGLRWQEVGQIVFERIGVVQSRTTGTKNRGRSKQDNRNEALAILESTTHPCWGLERLELGRFLAPTGEVALEDLECGVCNCVLNRPVQLCCQKVICLSCLKEKWGENDDVETAYPYIIYNSVAYSHDVDGIHTHYTSTMQGIFGASLCDVVVMQPVSACNVHLLEL